MNKKKQLVIVESPAKAKTINKYLGTDYTVLASMGHVRDLPSKNGSVDPEDGFAMVWESDPRSKKTVAELKKAMKASGGLVLATDPDREGEAISWHVHQILADAGTLKNKSVQRVTFNEITKKAVKEAFNRARDVDQNLVDAYLARRALDYLVGFNLSPILWRKLPGSRSAGRVQSVALRLICEREREIELFNPCEYWSITGAFKTDQNKTFHAKLSHLNDKKLTKFSLGDDAAAKAAVATAEGQDYTVSSLTKKQVSRSPAAPFITSTLQQEAARKLYFGASRTMRIAQSLYEGVSIKGETVGLITYMRTDGTTLSNDAISQARSVIGKEYGADYLPPSGIQYKSRNKNAQEAHEAIRPTDLTRRPQDLRGVLNDDQLKLYTLIWKRTIACQMAKAKMDQVAAELSSADGKAVFRATGSSIAFDGFLRVYMEGRDDEADDSDGDDKILPPLAEGMTPNLDDVKSDQHFTQPPPRYSEASLVKRLEELGIGRPSTYASIIQVLQDRNYVTVEQRRFTPQDRGRVVTAFLENFFGQYVAYDFTAELEGKLDEIAEGKRHWQKELEQFWTAFSGKIDETKDLRIQEVIRVLNIELEEMLYPIPDEARLDKNGQPLPPEDLTEKRRECPVCAEQKRADGKLSLKLGRHGAFIGCSNYPDCNYTRALVVDPDADDAEDAAANTGPIELGVDPETGKTVTARLGPYGPYVQLGEGTKPKPKRASLPKGTKLEDVTLDQALPMLRLPRELGEHPAGGAIKAGLGRFGPFVHGDGVYASIPKDEDIFTITRERAIDLIAEKKAKPPRGKRGAGKKAPTKKTAAKKSATKKKTATKKK